MTKIYTVEKTTTIQVVAHNEVEATKKAEELIDMCGEGDTSIEATLKDEIEPFKPMKECVV